MTTHTMRAEVEVRFRPTGCEDLERAHPTLDIEFDYHPGCRAYTPPGEYAPIDPPEPAEVSFREAKLIDGDELDPFMAPDGQRIVNDWAIDHLDSDEGYYAACAFAQEDRQPDPDYLRDQARDEPSRYDVDDLEF